jgi:DNA (cytosine-5)-methyltransferase 1
MQIPILSLFSGAGGLDLGFYRAGFIPRLAVDISPAAVKTYQRNHPYTCVKQLDLSEVPGEELISLWNACSREAPVGIIGGPPCQAFSVSNVHQRGNDPRAQLVERYADIIGTFARLKGLAFFVFENVTGLLGKKHRDRYLEFKRSCEAAGFRIYEKIIDAVRLGVPQFRPRIIVVGFNEECFGDINFEIPEGESEPVPVSAVLHGLPEPAYYHPKLKPEDIPFHPNHVTQRPKSRKFTNGSLLPGQVMGRSFRVLRWDVPSWTVAYGHREVHIHPNGHRRLSVYEAMLLQGFDHNYVLEGTLSQQITLVSDAVPPPVGEAIGLAVKEALKQARARQVYSVPSPTLLAKRDRPGGKKNKAVSEHSLRAGLRWLPAIREYFFSEWYSQNGRSFPWRERATTAFGLLVAEMLLRQTRAEMVAERWPLLIERFPSPADFSQAGDDDIWELVHGLGLGRQRSVALRAVSAALVERFGGLVPASVEELLSLPHVGVYTAHAVCVFAFGMRLPVVDSNVIRLFSRLTGQQIRNDNRRCSPAWEIAWGILPLSGVREHNYGLLDFAGTVCTPTRPRCAGCPLSQQCISYCQETVSELVSIRSSGGECSGGGSSC